VIIAALKYSDTQINAHYQSLKKSSTDLNKIVPGSTALNYLYMRSFYGDIAVSQPEIQQFFYRQSKLFWNKQNTYHQAMIAVTAYRNNEAGWVTRQVVPSLMENTITNSTTGLYWKNRVANSWFQQPVEHQSMMINCLSEINQTEKNSSYQQSINDMRTWLILNKQTNNWKTTIATADACYALLMNGGEGQLTSANAPTVQIQLGSLAISSVAEKKEAGSGYFKKTIAGEKILPEMGNIRITVKGNTSAAVNRQSYGNIYWQYIEDADKIGAAAGPLAVYKKLYAERTDSSGKVLVEIKDNDEIKLGEKLVVQLRLKTDRDMEYLHLKDGRASAMEPLNVLSGYKWQNQLGYYESTKDLSSNFFISFLPKGNYLISYELTATQIGIFSAGIASLQSMYAPEFSSHSAGIKIRITN
jgi:uncharacterized protein YfaS (alpha-2-macroglobulin family)